MRLGSNDHVAPALAEASTTRPPARPARSRRRPKRYLTSMGNGVSGSGSAMLRLWGFRHRRARKGSCYSQAGHLDAERAGQTKSSTVDLGLQRQAAQRCSSDTSVFGAKGAPRDTMDDVLRLKVAVDRRRAPLDTWARPPAPDRRLLCFADRLAATARAGGRSSRADAKGLWTADRHRPFGVAAAGGRPGKRLRRWRGGGSSWRSFRRWRCRPGGDPAGVGCPSDVALGRE